MARDLYGELDLNGNKIIGVANGVNPSDAVNKSQLDGHSHPSVDTGYWNYDTSEVMSDPGAGKVRTNTATLATTTQIAIDVISGDFPAVDLTSLLAALADGDLIFVQQADNASNWGRLTVSGTPVNNAGWFLITVVFDSGAGVAIGKNQLVVIRFTYGGGGGGGAGAEIEVTIDVSEPTPAVGKDIWIDPDAPDFVGGDGSGPASLAPPAVGATSVVGVGTDYARDDHTHAGATVSHSHVEGDLPSTLATDAEVTSAVSAHNSGANHVALSSTTPAALGAAGNVGVGTTSARADHVHVYPTAANVGAAAASHSHVEGDLPAAMATEAEVATAVSTHNSGAAHVPLTANNPVALGAVAVGNGTASARDNHVHPTTGLSLTGHSHVEGDLPSTLATDTEVTSAVSTHNSGSPHVALTANIPSALGAAAVGNGTASARDNHVHAMPTAANVGAAPTSHSHVEGDLPSTLATDTEVSTAVSNHLSGAPHAALSSTTPAALAAAGAVGVGTTVARADHVHIRPTPAEIGAAATSHTHAAGDVNSGTFAIALIPTGTTGTTVALGNHTHTQAQSHGTPDTDTGTGSLHHTIGTSATQAAAGNHTHATPTLDHGANLVGLADDDHIQYGLIVVSATQPGSPRVGTIWVPSG